MSKGERSFIARHWWLIPVAIVLIVAVVFFSYVAVYYKADDTALAAMVSDDVVRVESTSYGYRFDGPSDSGALIFYPGGKVDERAYAPLLRAVAAAGMDVCLVKMPFHLAVFGVNKADNVMEAHSYARYYLGGHSLGGAMAAQYASQRADRLSGLVLLAAYPTKALPVTLPVLSIVGSEDGVVNSDKLQAGRLLVQGEYLEQVIQGGNHAYFGSYGEQKGDGSASIAPADQWAETLSCILDFIGKGGEE